MNCYPTCGRPMPSNELTVNLETGIVSRGGQEIRLTPIQTEIVHALSNAGSGFMPHERLAHAVWGLGGDINERVNIRTQISRMRQSLQWIGVNIVSEWGRGYKIEVSQPAEAQP